MFVVMADITVKQGQEAEFEKWFVESTRIVSAMSGFKSRRLFRMHGASATYRIVFEHESKSTFVAMHNSPEHDQIFAKGRPLMESEPVRRTFDDVVS